MHSSLKFTFAFLAVALVAASCCSDDIVYKDASAPVEKRVEDLLKRMTLEEKLLQLNQYTLGMNTVENNLGEAVREIPAEIGSLIYFGDDAVLRNQMQHKGPPHNLPSPYPNEGRGQCPPLERMSSPLRRNMTPGQQRHIPAEPVPDSMSRPVQAEQGKWCGSRG